MVMEGDREHRLNELLNIIQGPHDNLRLHFLDLACGDDPELYDAIRAQITANNQDHSPTALPIGPGTRLGPFHIQKLIGSGGMGRVFLAVYQDEPKTKVALKITHSVFDPGVQKRIEKERTFLGSLKHPHIAQLYDGGSTTDGHTWFAMEYVEGVTPGAYCTQHRLTLQNRIKLFLDMCDAVSFAHQNLIIHRDLKPDNILVDTRGRVKLLDFGIAAALDAETGEQQTMTRVHEQVMTPEYASPEQVMCRRLTAATDVYSLGVILYELLTGSRPYAFETMAPAAIQRAICDTPITRPSRVRKQQVQPVFARALRGDLDVIVLKALEREVKDRYVSVEEMATDLRRHLDGLPIRARPATAGYRCRKFLARNRWPVALSTTLFLFLVSFSLMVLHQNHRIEQERTLALREKQTGDRMMDFLVSMFEAPDPDAARGRDISARELLERGRSRIDTALGDEKQARAQLLATIGRVYHSLGIDQDAIELLEEAAGWFRENGRDRQLVPALVRLSDAYKGTGEPVKARDPAIEAIHVAERLEDSMLLAQALEQQGAVLLFLGDTYGAEPLLQRNLDLRISLYGEEHAGLARSYLLAGGLFEEKGEPEKAEGYYRLGVALTRACLGSDHPLMVDQLNGLAGALNRRGIFDEAESLLRESLELAFTLYGESHPKVPITMNQLAQVAMTRGHREEAIDLVSEALTLQQDLFAREHPNTARFLITLGEIQQTGGDYEEAEIHYRLGLNLGTRVLGESHPEIIRARAQLAALLNLQGRYRDAATIFREILRLKVQLFGQDHPAVAESANDLGVVLHGMNEHDEAAALFRRALEIRRKRLSPNHPEVTESLNNLGVFYSAQGDLDQAEQLLREAVTLERKRAGGNHPDMIDMLNNLADLLHRRGTYEQAESLSREALERNISYRGEDHPRTIITMNNLALIMRSNGRDKEAERLMRKALNLRRARLGHHPRVATSLNNLAIILRDRGDYGEAEKLLREAITIDREFRGEHHLKSAINLHNLAKVRHQQGAFDEAETLMRRSLAIKIALLGEDHSEIALTHDSLGVMLSERDRHAEAIALLQSAIAMRRRHLDKGHPLLGDTLLHLGQALLLAGRVEEAKPLVEQARNLFARRLPDDHYRHHVTDSVAGFLLAMQGNPDQGRLKIENAVRALVRQKGQNGYETRRARMRLQKLDSLLVQPAKQAEQPR